MPKIVAQQAIETLVKFFYYKRANIARCFLILLSQTHKISF
ncbi:hypothetical protein HMPREF1320_0220 [Capnocytophaga sp. oral taxon 335 str. F0486]|nr:hypothetical protein HMPREF1320_0220 [Capnocytophaga sp. oral taxon 335 str. F0486]